MKAKLLLPLLAVCGFFQATAFAQDIHFSQFTMAPLTLNPALIGAYEGTFRIGGIYRDQWSSVTTSPSAHFVTPSIYIDAPIVRGFGKNDWVGVGAVVADDAAGTNVLHNTNAQLGVSYHLGLGRKSNNILTLGVQGGIVQKRFDRDRAVTEEIISGGANLDPLLINSNTNISYPDFNVGLLLNTTLSSKFQFNIGLSAAHVLEPNEAFSAFNKDAVLPHRYVAHGGLNIDLTQRWVLLPSFLYQNQAKASEFNIQALLGRHLNPARDITFLFGAGYRATYANALYPMVALNYKGLKAGIAYDINTSGISTFSQGRGGFEIGLSYTAKISKTPVVKPVLFCPRF